MMTPEIFASKLAELPDLDLKSVILFGSAAAGDHAGRRSNYNLLIVARHLERSDLDRMSGLAKSWARAGNPPPLLFTLRQLQGSADVFPIELLDMKDSRRVLRGEDVLAAITVHETNLRMEIEHELKGKLVHLRAQYLLTGGKPRRVRELMIGTIGAFLVLMRATLRLFEKDVPAIKLDAVRRLAGHVSIDVAVFETIQTLKAGQGKVHSADIAALFERYLKAIETVTEAVDAHLHA